MLRGTIATTGQLNGRVSTEGQLYGEIGVGAIIVEGGETTITNSGMNAEVVNLTEHYNTIKSDMTILASAYGETEINKIIRLIDEVEEPITADSYVELENIKAVIDGIEDTSRITNIDTFEGYWEEVQQYAYLYDMYIYDNGTLATGGTLSVSNMYQSSYISRDLTSYDYLYFKNTWSGNNDCYVKDSAPIDADINYNYLVIKAYADDFGSQVSYICNRLDGTSAENNAIERLEAGDDIYYYVYDVSTLDFINDEIYLQLYIWWSTSSYTTFEIHEIYLTDVYPSV